MTDAFRCDECGEFYEGDPAERLYRKEHHGRQGTDLQLRAELCVECSESFGQLAVDDDADGGEA